MDTGAGHDPEPILRVDPVPGPYWERVSFPFWFTDIVSALDTLSRLGLSPQSPPIARPHATARTPA